MLSVDKSYLLDDDSDDDGYESGSAGMCTFNFLFEDSVGRIGDSVGCVVDSVGRVRVVGSGVYS